MNRYVIGYLNFFDNVNSLQVIEANTPKEALIEMILEQSHPKTKSDKAELLAHYNIIWESHTVSNIIRECYEVELAITEPYLIASDINKETTYSHTD